MLSPDLQLTHTKILKQLGQSEGDCVYEEEVYMRSDSFVTDSCVFKRGHLERRVARNRMSAQRDQTCVATDTAETVRRQSL